MVEVSLFVLLCRLAAIWYLRRKEESVLGIRCNCNLLYFKWLKSFNENLISGACGSKLSLYDSASQKLEVIRRERGEMKRIT
jgi:hypothetical protein